MKYLKKFICLILLITILLVKNNNVQAKTLGEFKKELEDTETKLENNQIEKAETEKEIAKTKERINELNREKVRIHDEMDKLNEEIEELTADIEKMQKEIKSIMNYYQLSSSNSIYLEYVFNASSLTDFIYRLAVTEQLSVYRKNTIDKYNKLIEEMKQKIADLAARQVALNKLEVELSNELTKLGNNLESISEAAIDIQDEIKDLKSKIKLYEDTYKCKDNEEISVCEDRYYKSLNGSGSMPSAYGFYRPVTSGRINANYGYSDIYGSTYHYGMDIGVAHGTPVYSIANGQVVKVTYRSSCGGNMVYIAHIVNGVKYTSGYFHLSSINVKEGQIVTYDTLIGYSGGAPWIEYWDNCSTGPHLHLQMGTGLYTKDYLWYSNFQARSFNPRNILNFPGWGEWFSGR